MPLQIRDPEVFGVTHDSVTIGSRVEDDAGSVAASGKSIEVAGVGAAFVKGDIADRGLPEPFAWARALRALRRWQLPAA